MPAFRRMLLLSAAASTVVISAAGAQQSACKLELTKPSELQSAFLTLQTLKMGSPDARAQKLRQAVQKLTDKPEKIKNEVGRDVLLGMLLSAWYEQPGQADAVPAATIGYSAPAAAQINLTSAIDSLFNAAE